MNITTALENALSFVGKNTPEQLYAILREISVSDDDLIPPELDAADAAKFYEASGQYYRQTNQPEQALDAFRKMLACEEQAGESLAGLGFSHAKISDALAACGQYDEAVAELAIALRMTAEGAAAAEYRSVICFELGLTLERHERLGMAINCYRAGLAIAQSADLPGHQLAELCFMLGRALATVVSVTAGLGELLDSVEPLMMQDIDRDVESVRQLRDFVRQAEDLPQEAEEVLLTAARLYPSRPGVLKTKTLLAHLYADTNAYHQALQLAAEALALAREAGDEARMAELQTLCAEVEEKRRATVEPPEHNVEAELLDVEM